MNGKLIITKTQWLSGHSEMIFSGLCNDQGFYQVNFSENTPEKLHVGDILIGRVRDIVKNLNSAFIEIQPGITGYFSIGENPTPIYLNRKNTEKICQGDFVLVQIKKDAVKTKAPVLTSKISLTGKYLVLIGNDEGISVSGKITDNKERTRLSSIINIKPSDLSHGVIIRTNARNTTEEIIRKEYQALLESWQELYNKSFHRPAFYMMKSSEPEYLKQLKGSYKNEITEIITDDEIVCHEISEYLTMNFDVPIALKLYQDNLLPLYKLYSLEGLLKRITSRHVWLKSGAYLVIEPTEAMVVIDVNTGKCQKGKRPEETMLQVNLEAAKEIALQLQLRNLSGIIIIDFINMDTQEQQEMLIDALKHEINKDKIKTSFIEMTKLNLVLLTRKKMDAPVYEQIQNKGDSYHIYDMSADTKGAKSEKKK